MKTTLVLALLTLGTLTALSQTPEEIGNDFQIKAAKACEKIQATLQKEGTAIAARLVTEGDTAGAAKVSEQIKTKTNGGNVPTPHPVLTTLFSQYDTARQSALKPLQDTTLERLDSMLKSSVGKDMQNVMKIAKVREEVTAGPKPRSLFSDAKGENPLILENLFVDKSWYSAVGTEYHFEKGN